MLLWCMLESGANKIQREVNNLLILQWLKNHSHLFISLFLSTELKMSIQERLLENFESAGYKIIMR